jgi:hypothetical protein
VDQGPAPAAAEKQARKYLGTNARGMGPRDLDGLRLSLDERQPVVLGMLTFPNWDYPSVDDTGEITMPLPDMQSDGGHAVCVVGSELRKDVPRGRDFHLLELVG